MLTRPPRLTSTLSLLVSVAAVAAAAVGCGSSENSSSPPPASSAATVTVTATPSDSTSPSSAAASPTSGSATPSPSGASSQSASASGTPLCGTPDLRVTVSRDPGGGTAGAVHETLTFTDTADHACTIDGFPGVSFVSGSAQVGAAARRVDAADRTTVTLQPQDSATAALTVSDAGAYGDRCQATDVDTLKVYPPHNRSAATLPVQATGCAASSVRLLAVGPVVSG